MVLRRRIDPSPVTAQLPTPLRNRLLERLEVRGVLRKCHAKPVFGQDIKNNETGDGRLDGLPQPPEITVTCRSIKPSERRKESMLSAKAWSAMLFG